VLLEGGQLFVFRHHPQVVALGVASRNVGAVQISTVLRIAHFSQGITRRRAREHPIQATRAASTRSTGRARARIVEPRGSPYLHVASRVCDERSDRRRRTALDPAPGSQEGRCLLTESDTVIDGIPARAGSYLRVLASIRSSSLSILLVLRI